MLEEPVRCSGTSAVEEDRPTERSQLPEVRSDAGQVPDEVDVAAQSVAIEVVGGSITQDLIGDVGVADAHVLRLRRFSSDIHGSQVCLVADVFARPKYRRRQPFCVSRLRLATRATEHRFTEAIAIVSEFRDRASDVRPAAGCGAVPSDYWRAESENAPVGIHMSTLMLTPLGVLRRVDPGSRRVATPPQARRHRQRRDGPNANGPAGDSPATFRDGSRRRHAPQIRSPRPNASESPIQVGFSDQEIH